MFRKSGFTLIELLIVITIIAILAGAAIPFVQDYVEDARITRAKADLNEIKNALIRYEIDRGTQWLAAQGTTIAPLVGPYLGKSFSDPWGVAYRIGGVDSVCYSAGPNRTPNDTDDVIVEFRPPLALSKAYFIDVDRSGGVTSNDQIKLRFTREVAAGGSQADYTVKVGGVSSVFTSAATGVDAADSRWVLMTLTDPDAIFVPGRDTINVKTTTVVLDSAGAAYGGPHPCSIVNEVVIQPL